MKKTAPKHWDIYEKDIEENHYRNQLYNFLVQHKILKPSIRCVVNRGFVMQYDPLPYYGLEVNIYYSTWAQSFSYGMKLYNFLISNEILTCKWIGGRLIYKNV